MRISDWSSDVCSSDLPVEAPFLARILVKPAREQDRRGQTGRQRGLREFRHLMRVSPQREQPWEQGEQQPGEAADGRPPAVLRRAFGAERRQEAHRGEIGSAAGRERVCQYGSVSVVAVTLNKNKQRKMTISEP